MIRTILELSSRNSSRRIAREIVRQKPSRLPLRKEFSSAPSKNVSAKPGSTGKPEESGSSFPKVLIGSVAVGAAIMAAYQTGYLDQVLNKEKHDSLKAVEVGNNKENQTPLYQESNSLQNIVEDKIPTTSEVPEELNLNKEQEQEKTDNQTAFPSSDLSTERQDEIQSQEQDKSHVTAEEDKVLNQEKLLAGSVAPPDQSTDSAISAEGSPPEEIPDASTSMHSNEEVKVPQISTPSDPIKGDSEVQSLSPDPHQHLPAEGKNEEPHSTAIDTPPLLDAYHLRDKENGIPSVSVDNHGEGETFASGIKELGDAEVVSKDGKLILDFLQAIHAAELRQAELDARTYAEEKRALKEKYEKELKDAIARELMNAEEAALLDKELKRERAKAAAAVKSLQQKLEEKHKIELEEKEREAEMKLEKVEELAKAEMSAAIAREKATQIEKMNEANLHINALCMAFYARSEEARRTHSVHKLALGALALEDALSKGLPIKAEIEALQTYLQGIEKDSVLDVVLSSLPEETISHGTESVLQLNQQFDSIKGTLRHFSLIPPGGGGVLAHSVAYIASWLKVQNVDPSGEGIESVIGRVENYLAEGKLAEAADALEEGVKGSQAADIIHTWVKQTRNRAIAEQALTMLQSYATSVSLT